MEELINACKRGDIQAVKELHSAGIQLDQTDKLGFTPLYWAAFNGSVSLCDWLIGQGVSVNGSHGNPNSSPLHAAAGRGHHKCTALLIKRLVSTDISSLGCEPHLEMLNHAFYILGDAILKRRLHNIWILLYI